MSEITIKVTPAQVIKAVYDMCRPVGMGFLQYTAGNLTVEQAEKLAMSYRVIGRDGKAHYSLDYVGGRQCKFEFTHSEADNSCSFEPVGWHDHTQEELARLVLTLLAFGDAV